jgi:hypothetical protein
MKFNQRMTAIAGCAALLTAALTTGTAGAADETRCSTPLLTSTSVQLADPGRWAYTFKVTWCVKDGEITAVTPYVTHDQDGTTCVWVTNAEEKNTPVHDGSGAWTAYNMAEFSCQNGDGTDGVANPWGIIALWPNGASSVLRKGIGDVIVR